MTSHDHDGIDCSHALMQVYEYLDGEMGPDDCDKIREHLAHCGPCLKEYNIDQMLKTLVRRSCGCESAPMQLRMQIMARITTITVELQGY
jgi:anti-sigma factor, TIGR02949 family/mycothiol system anti-sigma-R factor